MKKVRSKYVCQSCGYSAPGWLGKCPECSSWNSFVEEIETPGPAKKRAGGTLTKPIPISEITASEHTRLHTGMAEFDRVMGGGVVKGGVILIAGSPGVGKSTLLLKVCENLGQLGLKSLYISGEESLSQIKIRSDRMSVSSEKILLLAETDVETISAVMRAEQPAFTVVDSIQTLQTSSLESLPGNVSQVRACGYQLTQIAKETQIPLFLVGHMTKEGSIAGPRILEHLVDGLILLEGDHQYVYRMLRSVKNRFGSTNEVGLFEMTGEGLVEVLNPSEYLLSQRKKDAPGSMITVSMEGSRPLMVEIQALVASSSYGIPQRTAMGVDPKRLAILLAVLEKRAGLKIGNKDVFVNAAGGLRLSEPGIDLAVTLAVMSSATDRIIESHTAVFGEVGLAGELRSVPHADQRIAEAARLGFNKVILPSGNVKKGAEIENPVLYGVESLQVAVRHAFA